MGCCHGHRHGHGPWCGSYGDPYEYYDYPPPRVSRRRRPRYEEEDLEEYLGELEAELGEVRRRIEELRTIRQTERG